ncbi:hypothetical protein Hamer_G002848 [Homarus americanus]|uniref:WH2 domain-containing protein n=1 Tax=Homarus americanus TaxID=6706 RepID=A0A8J5K253_HOMAM|nr:hypothetical protein Hamer_G002848 [Homarus americanus]
MAQERHLILKWGEEPSVSVGAWMERPSQPVGVYQDRDYVTSAPRSQSTQDLSSPPVPEERQRTPPRTTFVGPREPTRPPRRNSRQDSPPQETEATKPLTYFGQQALPQEPPPTYYYNGDGNSAPSKVVNSTTVTRPKELETEVGGPRYTSVVTLSSDKNDQPSGAPTPKDKVKSVVQLNNSDQRGQPRTAPVVRGFRQPGEEPLNQGGSTHSRIISNALRNAQPSQPQPRSSVSPPAVNGTVPTALSAQVPEAPTASRLVAAVSQSAPKAPSPSAISRISPPRTSPSRVSPPRTSPARVSPARTPPSRISPPSGPAFPNVQLRPVPAGLRASTPPESSNTTPPQPPPLAPVPPPVPANQMGNAPPPPPPPAPPMAPPPPPAPKVNDGERRTSSGKRIVSSKGGPELDAREELMMAIKNHGGLKSLRRSHN